MADAFPILPEDLEPTERGFMEGVGAGPLAFARWDHPSPRGRVVLLHGYGEHAERYRHTAAWLHRQGWAVSGLDQRGFGRSSGPRGDAHGIRGFVNDAAAFLRLERFRDRELAGVRSVVVEGVPQALGPVHPQILLGHSFGGLVALLVLLWYADTLEGLIVSSPVVVLHPLKPLEALAQRLLSTLAPHWVLNLPSDKHGVCSDTVLAQRFRKDPHCHQRMSAAFLEALREGGRELLPHAAELDRPILLLEAGCDHLGDHDAATPFWNGVDASLLERHRLEGFLHEVLHDRRRTLMYPLVEAWLARRSPGTLHSEPK